MTTGIKELVEISNYYGKNIDYVIAGGGNTSYKTNDKLWVKASGTSLATINESGFVCLSREKLHKVAVKTYSNISSEREEQVKQDLHESIIEPKTLRPSVETSMHEVIDYKFVVHTHPNFVNGLLCGYNSKESTIKLFGDEALYIPYIDPGYTLFKAVKEAIDTFKDAKGYCPKLIMLENHGIFVSADSVDEIKSLYNSIEEKITSEIKSTLPVSSEKKISDNKLISEIKKIAGKDLTVISRNSDLISEFTSSEEAFKGIELAFTPDNIVYCKARYLFINEDIDINKINDLYSSFKEKWGYAPKVIAIENLGIIGIDDSETKVNILLDVFVDMMKISFYSRDFGGPRFMTNEQIDFIDNWEVENYRRKMTGK